MSGVTYWRDPATGVAHRLDQINEAGARFVCGHTTTQLIDGGLPEDVCYECSAPSDGEAAAVAHEEALAGVRAVFGATLKQRQIEAVTKAKVAGVTHEDIGVEMGGTSKSAVSQWITRNIPHGRQVWRT